MDPFWLGCGQKWRKEISLKATICDGFCDGGYPPRNEAFLLIFQMVFLVEVEGSETKEPTVLDLDLSRTPLRGYASPIFVGPAYALCKVLAGAYFRIDYRGFYGC